MVVKRLRQYWTVNQADAFSLSRNDRLLSTYVVVSGWIAVVFHIAAGPRRIRERTPDGRARSLLLSARPTC